MEKTKKVIKISKRKIIFFGIIIVIVGIIFLGFKLFKQREVINYGSNKTNDVAIMPTSSENSKYAYPSYYPMPYPQNNPTVNDTREFLKTSYNTEIKTRNVSDVVHEVKNIVRDAEGRVDGSSENPKNGYVNFVVPKSNFEDFKYEIGSITNKKLIIENVSSENLLRQKQSIEEQQKTANNSLTQLQQQQKDLASKHTQIKNLNTGLRSTQSPHILLT